VGLAGLQMTTSLSLRRAAPAEAVLSEVKQKLLPVECLDNFDVRKCCFCFYKEREKIKMDFINFTTIICGNAAFDLEKEKMSAWIYHCY